MSDKVTLDQVRVAFMKAMEGGGCWNDVLAELTKPAVHPDVPVMYENRHIKRGVVLGTAYYTDEEEMVDGPMENVRPLIPVDTVREAAKSLTCDSCCDAILTTLDTYLIEGPDAI